MVRAEYCGRYRCKPRVLCIYCDATEPEAQEPANYAETFIEEAGYLEYSAFFLKRIIREGRSTTSDPYILSSPDGCARFTENLLVGDATIYASNGILVSFTNIVDSVTGETYDSMPWYNIPLEIDGFSYREVILGSFVREPEIRNRISGSFYGPAHEEVGGVFERNYIKGAFGAKKPRIWPGQ